MYTKVQNYILEDALDIMKRKEITHLHNCVIQFQNRNDIMYTLNNIKSNNYVLNAMDINTTVTYLMNCNILFYNGISIYPQKKLLQIAIGDFLST